MEIFLPTLYHQQQIIVDHPARFKVLACGRRFGKTQIAIEIMMNHILEGGRVAYFAPTQIMTDEVWREIKRITHPLIAQVSEHDYRLDFLNHAVFECWTARTEAVRGRKYHFIVMDEAALIPSADLWHAAVRPLLTDYRGGALFASTPRGRNWFWELYNIGIQSEIHDWQSWTFPTATNPYIDPAEVEEAKNTLPERVFQQEYCAEFLDDGGTVFRNVNTCAVGESILEREPGTNYVFGVDWGRDHDYTVISVMEIDSARQVYLDRFSKIDFGVQRQRIISLYERFRPLDIIAEANSIGAPNIEELRAAGLPVYPFYTSSRTKPELIERLVLALEKAEVMLLNDPILKHEFSAFEMRRTSTGYFQYAAPPGAHDDIVIATALSYHAAKSYGKIALDWV